MKKALCIVLVLFLAIMMAGCSSAPANDTDKNAEASATKTPADPNKPYAGTEIVVFNWFDYIDPNVIDMFTAETGIVVKYANFTNNEEMYTKLVANPGVYDVIVPSDYIIERLVKENGLEKLDLTAMPNVANLSEWVKHPSYDPSGEYSVPYMWGTVGILYNTTMVDEEITHWAQMFDTKYAGNVIMMDSYRDSLGITMKMMGYSLNERNPEALEAARDKLIEQKQNGIVKAYQLDETKDKMIAGEAALALVYSGDALYSMEENEDLAYVVPMEGSNIWLDAMCIPKGSKNVEAAQVFIDFMCRTDIARMNMDYIWYSTPIQTVIDEMSEEEKNNSTLNPSQEVIDRCEFFQDVAEYVDMYEEIWSEVRLAR